LKAWIPTAGGFGREDWERALINDDYFQEYAEELAYDIGAIDRDAGWPLGCMTGTGGRGIANGLHGIEFASQYYVTSRRTGGEHEQA
jgi:hypothetical protein